MRTIKTYSKGAPFYNASSHRNVALKGVQNWQPCRNPSLLQSEQLRERKEVELIVGLAAAVATYLSR